MAGGEQGHSVGQGLVSLTQSVPPGFDFHLHFDLHPTVVVVDEVDVEVVVGVGSMGRVVLQYA